MAASYTKLSNDEESFEMIDLTDDASERDGAEVVEVLVHSTAAAPSDAAPAPPPPTPPPLPPPPPPRPEKRPINILNANLLKSISEKQVEQVQRLLCDGASANATCESCYVSAVHMAALDGDDGVLQLLVEYGAIVWRTDKEGRSPLHVATSANQTRCVEFLLKECPELLQVNVGDDQFLGEAVDTDWLDCAIHDHESLKNQLASLEHGSSALHLACQRGYLECASLLIRARARVNATDGCGMTCLDVVGEKLLVAESSASSVQQAERLQAYIQNDNFVYEEH